MIWRLLLVALFLASGAVGFAFRDREFRLDSPYMESDQAVLAHADSAYTSMTWVASQSGDYLQLRFFDKVEGGICLRPTWQDLVALHDPRLAHLDPGQARPSMDPPGRLWPYSWTPDPGTVSNSPYVRLFPLSMLLNDPLVAQAGGDARAVTGRILVVGLGSGAGIAVLAHHFPNLAITVVDIDHKVIDIVRAHFPLIRWLSDQHRADGEPRLQFRVGDARQFIHFQGEHAASPYDAIILDAYTAGSTIPPHLMTVEFFRDCARMLSPSGVLLANIIGSYGQLAEGDRIIGEKHRVLGGAIRSIRVAGLTHVVNFPVLNQWETSGAFDWEQTRNNIVCASRQAIEATGSDDPRWKRLDDFVLFPEVPAGVYLTHRYFLMRQDDPKWSTAMVDAQVIDSAEPALSSHLTAKPTALPSVTYHATTDAQYLLQARHAVSQWAASERHGRLPVNWDEPADELRLYEIDCVAYARDTYLSSVTAARDGSKHSGQALVGDVDEPDPHHTSNAAIIRDAPLFTDQRPNGDILNR